MGKPALGNYVFIDKAVYEVVGASDNMLSLEQVTDERILDKL